MSIAEEARKILLLEAFADEAKRIAAESRAGLSAKARQQLAAEGIAPSWTLPEIATITLGVTQTAAFVADRAKFTAWVAAHYPEELEQTVRPSFEKRLIASLAIEGESAVDRDTGAIVPGIAVRQGGQPANLSIKPKPGIKADMAAMVTEMLATAHPAIAGPVEEAPKAPDDPWIPAGDPFAAFPARGAA